MQQIDFPDLDYLAFLIQKYAVRRGNFDLSSGLKSNYFIDLPQALLRGHVLALVARYLWQWCTQPPPFDLVAGPVTGACPLVDACLLEAKKFGQNMRGAYVRHKEDRPELIGDVKKGDRVLVVEDVVTTGLQVLAAITVLEEAGCKIYGVTAVVDRLAGAKELLSRYGLGLRALLTVKDLGLENQSC